MDIFAGGTRKCLYSSAGVKGKLFTLARLVDGPAIGVPSLFFLTLEIGRDLSRTGLTFKSTYLRHFVPQMSHSIFVGKPLGAFHHVSESRVRHAPQLRVFEGWAMMDDLSS